MHIIIIGGGEVGYALARSLASQHDVFVIDKEPEVADRFGQVDVKFVTGSGTSDDVLREVGIEDANLLIACTGLDEVNIIACALANQLGSPQTICFVSSDDFLRPVGGRDILREHFGIDRVIWPEAQLAADIERVIAAPGAIDAEIFAGGQVRLLEYRMEPDSPLTAGPISTLHLPLGTNIVALKRDDVISIPRGRTQLLPGDKVIVMGSQEGMRALETILYPADDRRTIQNVTIIGGGDVGFRLAQQLDDRPNIRLRVIEGDRYRGELIASVLRKALVLNGDGTDLELLEAEEIGQSDVLISVIDHDEKNLLASLLGRQLGVPKIITRVSKPANMRLFERVGIDAAISARGAAVAAVLHQIEGGKAKLLAVLEEGQGKVLELEVPAGYPRTALGSLSAPGDSIIGAILRGSEVVVPRGKDYIQAGDHLLVFSTAASAELVRDFFSSAKS